MAGPDLKVIYIMGAGHIGSTVLDVVMSSHPKLESLGEVSKFHGFGWLPDDNRHCACGSTVHDCPFWSEVRHRWSVSTGSADAARYMMLQSRYERTAAGWRRLFRNRLTRTSEFAEYQEGTEAIYRAVQQTRGAEYLVDSSLTPKRAYAQAMNPNVDLYLIHLVRDGRGVIWSLMKPNKKIPGKAYVPAPPQRTTKYWVSANLQSAWVFRSVEKRKRLRIRYEDFALDPPSVLSRIGALIGEDMSGLVKEGMLTNPSNDRHTVGGNRVRFIRDEDIRVRADFAWMDKLEEKYRTMFWRRAGWLARRFGYVRDQVDYGAPARDPAVLRSE
jgi:hypothetical protein